MNLFFRKKYETYRSILLVISHNIHKKEGIFPEQGEIFKSTDNENHVFTSFKGGLR